MNKAKFDKDLMRLAKIDDNIVLHYIQDALNYFVGSSMATIMYSNYNSEDKEDIIKAIRQNEYEIQNLIDTLKE